MDKTTQLNFLNRMLKHTAIPVEEALIAMEPEVVPNYAAGEVHQRPHKDQTVGELARKFRVDEKEFIVDWWHKHILPNMNEDAFRRIVQSMRRELDIPPHIEDPIAYINDQVLLEEAHREDVIEAQLRGEYEEGSPEWDACHYEESD